MNMATDATDNKHPEESQWRNEARFQLFFEKSADAMLLLDGDVFIDCNQAAVEMMRCSSKEQLLILRPYDISPEKQPDGQLSIARVHDTIAAALREGSQRFEWVHRAVDGTDFPVEVLLTAISLLDRKVLHVVWRDITEQKQAQEALQSAYQLLEQRVDERTRELSTLLQVSHNIASTLEMEPLLGLILDQLKGMVDYSGSAIMALDEEILTILSYRGTIPQEEIMQMRFSLDSAPVNHAVIRSREPIIIPDFQGDTPLAGTFRKFASRRLETNLGNIYSWMGVPLIVKEKVIGMLSMGHGELNFYTPRHAELAFAFANQVAVAIENARLYQAEQERQRELQALLAVTAAASSSLELDELLSAALKRLVTLAGASRAGVMLLDGESGELEPIMLHPEHLVAADDLAELVQACRGVIASSEQLYVPPDPTLGYIEPGALLPLRVRGQALGVLVIIGKKDSTFSERHLALFESIADQLGVAIENARLHEQAELAAVAAERNRLARDLHDAVSQTLFSASLIADVLPKLWKRNPEAGQQKLDELRSLTRGALSEMRTLLLELRPAALVEMELGNILRHLTNAFIGRTRIPVTLTLDVQVDPKPDVKEVFYRVAQETLNNINKHAGASLVTVHLHRAEDQLRLEVQDDGCGFDPSVVSPESLGLGIMRERTEAIGAQLEIHSEMGRGTRIILNWKDKKE